MEERTDAEDVAQGISHPRKNVAGKQFEREQEKLSEKLESLQNDLDGLRDQKAGGFQAQAKIYSAARERRSHCD